MKRISTFAFALIFAIPISSMAQKNNKIELSAGRFYVPKSIGGVQGFLQQSGISYTRKISNKLSLSASYTDMPFLLRDLFRGFGSVSGSFYFNENPIQKSTLGKVIARHNGKFIDVTGIYTFLELKRHKVSVEAGFSTLSVLDEYLVDYKENLNLNNEMEYRGYLNSKNMRYYGGLAGLRYDFSLMKNRLNIGAYFKARAYNKDFPFQMNYGVQLGFSF